MIRAQNIVKKFSNKVILDNISFEINKGDKVAIIGQSGVGKSVLIKHINGLLLSDSGEIYIDNKKLNNLDYIKLQKIRMKMSMVFQFGALFDSMNIYDNIALALNNHGGKKYNQDQIKKKISNVLKLVNLEGIEKLMPSEISGGMKKRVGIARAISVNPNYILYDEPTTGLDPISTDEINKLILKVAKKHVTSIIVTHDMKTVYEVANKVIMLYNGKIIFDGIPKDLKRSNNKYIKYFVTGSRI